MNDLQLELTRLIGKKEGHSQNASPATLSDFHRWMNEKHSDGKIDVWEQREYGIWIFGQGPIKYNSSKDLLDQDESVLKQIIEIVKAYIYKIL